MWGRWIAIFCLAAALGAGCAWALSEVRLGRFSIPLGTRNRVLLYSGYGVMTVGFNRAQRQPQFSTIIYLKSAAGMKAVVKRERAKGLPSVDFERIKAFSFGHHIETLPDASERDVWSASLPYWLMILILAIYPGVRGMRYLMTPRCRNCRVELVGCTDEECPDCGYPIPTATRRRLRKA